ncbi:MAG: hypothetical protein PVI40_01075 [Chlamydiota bacterium]|jgi:hypothetical protein
MKKIITISLFLIVGYVGYLRLDGFQVQKIINSELSSPKWDIQGDVSAGKKKEISKLLKQDFIYLNKGHQCFVFESADGKYVLKLINHDRFKLPEFLRFFSFLPFMRKIESNRKKRLRPTYESFYLAYKYLKKETGLIYMQLGENDLSSDYISLIDRTKIKHKVPIANLQFMIQRKVEMIYPTLDKIYHEEGKEAFKNAIDSFARVLITRCLKNIADDDLDVAINYGFIENKAVLIDPGRLFYQKNLSQTENIQKELLKSSKNFRAWLQDNYPEFVPEFEKRLMSYDDLFLRESL